MAEGITMPVIPLATGNLLSLPPKVVTVQVSYPLARQARKYRWWQPLRISSRIWPRSRTILVAAMALTPASGEKPA